MLSDSHDNAFRCTWHSVGDKKIHNLADQHQLVLIAAASNLIASSSLQIWVYLRLLSLLLHNYHDPHPQTLPKPMLDFARGQLTPSMPEFRTSLSLTSSSEA